MMEREWFSLPELAAEKLRGMPETAKGMREIAKRLGWDAADTEGTGWRLREARGGGQEFHYSVLPSYARPALVAKYTKTNDLVIRKAAQLAAKNCRHLFTTNVYWGGFIYMTPWLLGCPKHFLVVDGEASDGFNAPFDTHWGCYFGTFRNCLVHGVAHLNRNVSASIGFQNRGFGTTYQGCVAIGAVVGFRSSAENLPCAFVQTVRYLGCDATDYQLTGFDAPVAWQTSNNRIEYDACVAKGDGRAANTPYLTQGYAFAGSAVVRMHRCTSARFNSSAAVFSGGSVVSNAWVAGGRVWIDDLFVDMRDNPSVASCIRINGPTTEFHATNVRVHFDTTHSTPTGIFRNAASAAYPGAAFAIDVSGFCGAINHAGVPWFDSASLSAITFNNLGPTAITGQDALSYANGTLTAATTNAYKTGNWYPSRPAQSPTSVTATLGNLFALPFEVRQRAQVTGICARVLTPSAGGGQVRLGIYSNTGSTGLPGALLLDGGLASTDVAGGVAVSPSGGPTLTAGTYHLVAEISNVGTGAAPTFAGAPACPELSSVFGGTTAVSVLGSAPCAGIQAGNGTGNTGALPSNFPTPSLLSSAAAPVLALQLSPV